MVFTGGNPRKHRQGLSNHAVRPVRHPWPTLFFGGTEDTLRTPQRLNVQMRYVGIAVGAVAGAVWQTNPNLEVIVEHHLILP